LYDDGPDRRATLRFGTDDPAHPEVVVKVNLFPLLSGSAAAHRLVSRGSPSRVPRVIATDERGEGSMILLATFEGRAVEAGSLPEMARTLGRIQIECAAESAGETGLETVTPAEIPRLFHECLANIEAHFAAWSGDEGKVAAAMGFPGAEVLDRLGGLRRRVDGWVEALEEPGIPLSIEHGDGHAGNGTCLADGRVLIFDWENASRSHPFLSAEKMLTSGWGLDTGKSGGPWGYVRETPTQDELKQAYLGEFGGSSLERAFDAAMGLAVIKEMHHEMEWARRCGWKDLNPEWTAQLVRRLFEHAGRFGV